MKIYQTNVIDAYKHMIMLESEVEKDLRNLIEFIAKDTELKENIAITEDKKVKMLSKDIKVQEKIIKKLQEEFADNIIEIDKDIIVFKDKDDEDEVDYAENLKSVIKQLQECTLHIANEHYGVAYGKLLEASKDLNEYISTIKKVTLENN